MLLIEPRGQDLKRRSRASGKPAPGRKRSVARSVLDVAVAQIRLQRARIDAVICQLVTAGVAQHMRVRFDAQVGSDGGTLDHARESRRGQWRAALGYEHER